MRERHDRPQQPQDFCRPPNFRVLVSRLCTSPPLVLLGVASLTILASCQTLEPLVFDGNAPRDASDRRYSPSFTYQERERGDVSSSDFFWFEGNLKQVYLDLAPGEHKSFVPSTPVIDTGTQIENSEQVGDQLVTHRYKVTMNRERGEVVWISNPSTVRILTWGFVIDIATVLTLRYDGEVLNSRLDLVFGSKRDLDASLGANVRALSRAHHEREMHNASKILSWLKESGQLYQDPSTWGLRGIRAGLS